MSADREHELQDVVAALESATTRAQDLGDSYLLHLIATAAAAARDRLASLHDTGMKKVSRKR